MDGQRQEAGLASPPAQEHVKPRRSLSSTFPLTIGVRAFGLPRLGADRELGQSHSARMSGISGDRQTGGYRSGGEECSPT
ncbi:hypothetical protein GCM10023317_32080 [Actinopolymorpha pittospori]|uniref:Uncharacterized protein n=1 Tax=Actinopolymorpha pittospori TaxID=648752 RepID=A0A927RCH8_9ACTN|nr:hypothetical protein [Actinopolymorpha pittospori]